jgi:hypothetical protein
MKYILFLLLSLTTLAFAVDMAADSEQFYVTQGLFDELEIEREPCEQQDDFINFACGTYSNDVAAFKTALSDYVRLELPGLYPASDWFNSGASIAKDYRSTKGQYLFAYNPGGLVVVAFVPKQ